MSWLEEKYIGLMSGRLRNFKRKGNGRYNFACPICGDSTTDKKKSRGNIYTSKGSMRYHCFNCGVSMGVSSFIKEVDKRLYSEYSIERLRESGGPKQTPLDEFVAKMKKPVFMSSGPLKGLKKISQLSPDDPMKQYVVGRRIPNPYHAKLFKCPNFFAWANEVVPNKFETGALAHDETRLLIPFIDKDGSMYAFQGRSMSPNSRTKYITVIVDETKPKVYGLDTVDFTKRTYVLEGPIDSIFIPNSIATAGGDLVSALHNVAAPKTSLVVVYDNEPRSRETMAKVEKAVNQGYRVCIWPDSVEQKDVNEMVMAGMSPDQIRYIIDQNTHEGLAARVALKRWSRI